MSGFNISRRRFVATGTLAVLGWPVTRGSPISPTASLQNNQREADFYEKRLDGAVVCNLCPRGCVIGAGKRGYCRIRENRGGRLVALTYGKAVALTPDPIEKKPFFHVLPGHRAFSLATVGCNFACSFCQNYNISQATPEEIPTPFRSPAEIVRLARETQCHTLAFTYTEPVVFYEYMADCARAARAAGLRSLMISNGYIREEPMRALLPMLTAVKIDFKSFSESFYRDICAGRLTPVLDTLKRVVRSGVWLEIVTLLIPTLNDSEEEIRRLCGWILKELGPDIPLHFSRFHPAYRLRNLPPTPYDTLQKARTIGIQEGLHFVYIGNAPGLGGEDTACPSCKQTVIRRRGFQILENRIPDGVCPSCHTPLPGRWN